MREVAKDIIQLKFSETDTLQQCLDKFFTVMLKHGIKEGTPTFNDDGQEVGRTMANFEWTICFQLFQSRIQSFIELHVLFGNVPKELLK